LNYPELKFRRKPYCEGVRPNVLDTAELLRVLLAVEGAGREALDVVVGGGLGEELADALVEGNPRAVANN
jgi:hypothetical protein